MARWFYNDGTSQQGPLPLSELKAALHRQELGAKTMVWKEGWPEWRASGTVPELQGGGLPAPNPREPTSPQGTTLPPAGHSARPVATPAPAASPAKPTASAPAATPGASPTASPTASSTSTPAPPTAAATDWNDLPSKFLGFFDTIIDRLRPLLSEARLQKLDGISATVGGLAGLAGLVLANLAAAVAAIKLEKASPLVEGFYFTVFAALSLYVGRRLVQANRTLLGQHRHKMSSADFLDSVGALLVTGGLVTLVMGLVDGIQQESMSPVLTGLGACIAAGILGLLCLSPASVNISIESKTAQGEDAIAILCLLPKCILRVVPALIMLGTVVASGLFLFSVTDLFDDNVFLAARQFGTRWHDAATLFVAATLLPLASYLSFVLLTLVLDVLRAVLVLPSRLDDTRGG